jgi:hypothetical protein
VDQFVELFKRLGPPPGVNAKAEIPPIALMESDSEPSADSETDSEEDEEEA